MLEMMLPDEVPRRPFNPATLCPLHRFLRLAAVAGRPRLHLDEHQRVAKEHDQINLALGTTVVTGHDPPAQALQVPSGQVLTPPPQPASQVHDAAPAVATDAAGTGAAASSAASPLFRCPRSSRNRRALPTRFRR